MRYLVTGGTGFLGGHLVQTLLARGDHVVALGRDPERCLCLEQGGASVIRCELTDQNAVTSALSGIDVVFHVAALTAPWGPYHAFHEANVTATENVVRAALSNGVRRLILVSSPSVTFDPRNRSITDETTPFAQQFLSPYQATKKLAEDVVNAARGRMECVILRPKAIFGPGDRALVPRLIDAARRHKLRQIGDGTNLVDVTYVHNVVDGLLLAAASPNAPGNTYLITNGEHISLWPLLRRILEAAGCEIHFGKVSQSVAHGIAALMEWNSQLTGREPAMTRYTVAVLACTQTYSIAAAQRDLDYVPRVSVEDAVTQTLPWLQEFRFSR